MWLACARTSTCAFISWASVAMPWLTCLAYASTTPACVTGWESPTGAALHHRLGDPLDVEQVLVAHVVGGGVAAPGAAAESERRLQAGRDPAAAERGRGVHEQAACGDLAGEALAPSLVVGVDDRRVAGALVGEQPLAQRHRLVVVVDLEDREQRRQAFLAEDLLPLLARGREHEQPCARWNLQAGALRDQLRAAPYELEVEVARGKVQAALDQLRGRNGVQDEGTLALQRRDEVVIDRRVNDEVLLGAADQPVVEGLAVDHRARRAIE